MHRNRRKKIKIEAGEEGDREDLQTAPHSTQLPGELQLSGKQDSSTH